MKSHVLLRRAILGALALGPALGCGAPQHKVAATPADMPMPSPRSTSAPLAHAAPDVDDDVPPAPRAHVDTRACEPAGKFVVVVSRDADGRPDRWRYFETRHGRRSLTCEAADSNGDGKVDARFFYDRAGHLVMEQRDLDFDGHAEVVADYSQFKFAAHTTRARDRN